MFGVYGELGSIFLMILMVISILLSHACQNRSKALALSKLHYMGGGGGHRL